MRENRELSIQSIYCTGRTETSDETGNDSRDTDDTSFSPREILKLLSDSNSQLILSEAATSPVSVNEIVESCSMSTATAYRKVNNLVEAGLLEEHVCVRPKGTNFRKFTLRIEAVHVNITENGTPRISVSLDSKRESQHSMSVLTDGGTRDEMTDDDKRHSCLVTQDGGET